MINETTLLISSPSNHPTVNTMHAKLKILGFAIFIILSLGSLLTAGTGLVVYIRGSLDSLSQIVLITVGGGLGLLLLVSAIIYRIKQSDCFKTNKNLVSEHESTASENIDPNTSPSECIKWEDIVVVDYRYQLDEEKKK
jgi:hypothetical protein